MSSLVNHVRTLLKARDADHSPNELVARVVLERLRSLISTESVNAVDVSYIEETEVLRGVNERDVAARIKRKLLEEEGFEESHLQDIQIIVERTTCCMYGKITAIIVFKRQEFLWGV